MLESVKELKRRERKHRGRFADDIKVESVTWRYSYSTEAPARWLAWNENTVPRLAQTIYDERAFDRLPILADALEEAGCTDTAILDHCRQPGEHYRGCWAVDLLLGKS
jgi:hypothetical protein